MNRGEWLLRQQDIMSAVHEERELALKLLHQSNQNIRNHVRGILNPAQSDIEETPTQKITSWISKGMTIYEGLRIGITIVHTFNNLFGGRRKRRKHQI